MRRTRRESGQTLVLALIVTVVLMVLGFVFVSLIGRNFFATRRFGETATVDYYAKAGIDYAARQLTYSEEGADWRPVPNNLPDTPLNRTDPDYEQLKPFDAATGDGGFTRVDFEKGRALIRVTYNPQVRVGSVGVGNAISRLIKLESIGKLGRVDKNDPSLYAPGTRQPRREMVAYVQLGLTDYGRYVTNTSNKTTAIEIGAPNDIGTVYVDRTGQTGAVRVPQMYGTYPVGNNNFQFGGAMRFNGDVKIYGDVAVYVDPQNNDGLFSSGRILTDGAQPKIRKLDGAGSFAEFPIVPSSAAFNSLGGIIRDGDPGTAVDKFARGITRLEPPMIDEPDPSSGQLRYRLLTRDSGFLRNGYQTGRAGYGQGVYVDNIQDVQRESSSLFGGYSLRADLLGGETSGGSSGARGSGYWNGPFYEPPGATLEFFDEPNNVEGKRTGFVITRDSRFSRNNTWRNLNGAPTPNHSLVYWFRSDDPTNRAIYNQVTMGLPGTDPLANIPFNGVLYFEGNVRVQGRIPRDRQFLVVSGGNVFIDGNLVKANERATCGLLAKENVVVNTTQFFHAGFENTPRWVRENVGDANDIPHARVTSDPMSALPINFSVGRPENTRLWMFVSHAGSGSGTYINTLVNGTTYLFPISPSLVFNYPNATFVPTFALDNAYDVYPGLQRTVLPLWPYANGSGAAYPLSTVPGVENQLLFRLDPAINSRGVKQPYFLSKVAVMPLDIRIEALMYAQTGSFIVVPGPWFNENPEDRKDALFANAQTTDPATAMLWRRQHYNVVVPGGVSANSPDYPYYGEPLPIRITVRGAIAENFPLPMSDQAMWLRHWGWMPAQLGLSNLSLTDVAPQFYEDLRGTEFDVSRNPPYIPNLIIQYDPSFATARTLDPNNTVPIRVDEYGRLLPPIPRLPVCPDLIYSGEARL